MMAVTTELLWCVVTLVVNAALGVLVWYVLDRPGRYDGEVTKALEKAPWWWRLIGLNLWPVGVAMWVCVDRYQQK